MHTRIRTHTHTHAHAQPNLLSIRTISNLAAACAASTEASTKKAAYGEGHNNNSNSSSNAGSADDRSVDCRQMRLELFQLKPFGFQSRRHAEQVLPQIQESDEARAVTSPSKPVALHTALPKHERLFDGTGPAVGTSEQEMYDAAAAGALKDAAAQEITRQETGAAGQEGSEAAAREGATATAAAAAAAEAAGPDLDALQQQQQQHLHNTHRKAGTQQRSPFESQSKEPG